MAITVVFWGCAFVATKIALRELSPVPLVTCRFALGTLFLLTLVKLRGDPLLPPLPVWPMLALMGFIGVFVHHLLQGFGLQLTSAITTGWLIGLIPIWSALFSRFFLKERFSRMKIVGLIGGFAGALLVITRGNLSLSTLHVPSTRGDFIILISTANWATYTIVSYRTIKQLGPARATAGMMLFGWLMLLPFFVFQSGWREIAHLSFSGWLAVAFLGFGSSGLGYYLYYRALEQLEVSRVAAFSYVQPLITLCAAMLVLHESAGIFTIVGGIVVLVSVVIVQRAA